MKLLIRRKKKDEMKKKRNKEKNIDDIEEGKEVEGKGEETEKQIPVSRILLFINRDITPV